MLKKFKEYFGFIKEQEISVIYPDSFEFVDHIDLKKEYLIALDTQEASRQTIIESKTSQLIGQAGIIFSLLSLFISNYFSKFKDLPITIQLVFIFLFVIILFLYLTTIFQATKYLNVKKYSYAQRSVSTVMSKFNNDNAFKVEEIKDLIYSIERNTKVNNQKCNNLIYAYRSFKIATIGVGVLSILLILSGYFVNNNSPNKVVIANPVMIQGLDSTIKILQTQKSQVIKNTVTVPDTTLKLKKQN